MSSVTPVSGVRSFIESRPLGPHIALTEFSGHSTLELAQLGLNQFKSIIAGMDRPAWICDSRWLTGFDRASIAWGRHWYEAFKGAAGRHLIMVSHWNVAMMAGRAMGLGFGVYIDTAPKMEQAVRMAEEIIRKREAG